MRKRIVKWREGDPEDELWVCEVCDAHLHADCVGDTCPECGAEIDDEAPTSPPSPIMGGDA